MYVDMYVRATCKHHYCLTSASYPLRQPGHLVSLVQPHHGLQSLAVPQRLHCPSVLAYVILPVQSHRLTVLCLALLCDAYILTLLAIFLRGGLLFLACNHSSLALLSPCLLCSSLPSLLPTSDYTHRQGVSSYAQPDLGVCRSTTQSQLLLQAVCSLAAS